MKTLFLLIVLTQNGAGDINASFVNTRTLEQCQQKALLVEGVFKGSDIPVIESLCTKSNLQFSEFGHAASTRMINNFYQIKFDGETPNIKAMENWRVCRLQVKDKPVGSRLYCASSVQSLK